MVEKLEFFQELATDMIEADHPRDEMFQAMDAMWHAEWELPWEAANMSWLHKVVSTDPHDAVRAGTRVLSSVEPRIKLQPTAPLRENMEKADSIERALGWHFKTAARRKRSSVLRDVVHSALLYDEIIAQVVYLPYQIKELESFKGEDKRMEMALRYGPFSIIVRNPQHVNVRYSDYMPEGVLMRRVIRLHEAMNFWGSKAKKLQRESGLKKNAGMNWVTIFEYQDLDARVVWGSLHESANDPMVPNVQKGIEILREDHKIPFLPWIARAGGSNLFPDEERVPLLYSIYQADQWETQNMIETFVASEAIAYAASPRYKKISASPDSIKVDHTEPGGSVDVFPGEDFVPLDNPRINDDLMLVGDRISNRIAKSTVPRVLQTGDFPSGTAFATLNLATQSGVKSLNPYKELAEQALSDIFVQMLYWIDFAGGDDGETAFVSKPQEVQSDPTDPTAGIEQKPMAEQITIRPGDFDVETLFIDVELTPDVPTDRMSRINAASIAVDKLGYPRARGMEQSGVADPMQAMKEGATERKGLFEEGLAQQIQQMQILGDVQRGEQQKNFELQMQQQAQAMQFQQAMQEQGQQQGGGQQQNGVGAPAELLGNEQVQQEFTRRRGRTANTRGEGFNRSGGGSTSEGDPNLNREEATGQTFTGEDVG